MDCQRKKALQKAFEAPAPVGKKAFLKKIRQPSIGQAEFMLWQACYIRKWVWIISAAVFGAALVLGLWIKREMLWTISALMPFVALAAVTEKARSEVCGMAELEMASRFSLQSVLMARMGIVGMSHLILLCALVPVAYRSDAVTFVQAGVYLLVPYLLTSVSGFWIVRRIRGREGLFGCLSAAVLVSGMYFVFEYRYTELYMAQYFPWWVMALAVLLAAAVREFEISFHLKKEEPVWN